VDCAIGVQFLVIIPAHRSQSGQLFAHASGPPDRSKKNDFQPLEACCRRLHSPTRACNGFINIDYQPSVAVSNIGDTRTVELRFGTGSIQQGTKLTITSFQFNLDCNSNDPLPPLHR
jgi:hypothetical protein